jgi:hypothetical protein
LRQVHLTQPRPVSERPEDQPGAHIVHVEMVDATSSRLRIAASPQRSGAKATAPV